LLLIDLVHLKANVVDATAAAAAAAAESPAAIDQLEFCNDTLRRQTLDYHYAKQFVKMLHAVQASPASPTLVTRPLVLSLIDAVSRFQNDFPRACRAILTMIVDLTSQVCKINFYIKTV
jgi:hypothetical protein